MKYRIKFSKEEKMRFIGHLDLLKLFQRAINRANLPVIYSNGFNPHQLIGFAVPLPLGMSSVGEYVDIEFSEENIALMIKDRLNKTMPEGIKICDVREHTKEDKSCAAIVAAALYEISLYEKIDGFSDICEKMLSEERLEIERISKGKKKIVNIRPDIFYFDEIRNSDFTSFKIIISTGSRQNLKPELFVEYIYRHINRNYEPLKVKYKRIELFKYDNEKFMPL